MEHISIAAIGDRASVMIFQALGVETVFTTGDPADTERAIHRLAKAGCAVIYITEQAADTVPEALARYKTAPFPAIIPIPGREGSLGLGIASVKKSVERAVGADILFKD